MKHEMVLITGGAGQLGLGVAEAAVAAGAQVCLVGRSRLRDKPLAVQRVIASLGASYKQIDVYDAAKEGALRKLASDHRFWINCAEPYLRGGFDLAQLKAQAHSLYRIAGDCGFRASDGTGKTFVRVGSPPAEIWEDRALQRKSAPEGLAAHVSYPEDLPLSDAYMRSAAFQTPYFRCKQTLATVAREAANQGLRIVTAAPTGLLGPYSTRADAYEPMLLLLRGRYPFNVMLPGGPSNVIALSRAADGILLVAKKGRAGEVYQLSGQNLDASAPFRTMLELAGKGKRRLVVPLWFPGMAVRGTRLLDAGLRRFGRKTPWWLYPDFYALMGMMGRRSSTKAAAELAFETGGREEITTALGEMLNWYCDTGKWRK